MLVHGMHAVYEEWLPGCGGVETKVSDVGLQH